MQIRNILDMRKLFLKTFSEIPERISEAHQWWYWRRFAGRDNDFVARLVIIYETWPHHYNHQTKQQWVKLFYKGSLHTITFRNHKSDEKFLPAVFLNKDVISLINWGVFMFPLPAWNNAYLGWTNCKNVWSKNSWKAVPSFAYNAPVNTPHKIRDCGFELVDGPS